MFSHLIVWRVSHSNPLISAKKLIYYCPFGLYLHYSNYLIYPILLASAFVLEFFHPHRRFKCENPNELKCPQRVYLRREKPDSGLMFDSTLNITHTGFYRVQLQLFNKKVLKFCIWIQIKSNGEFIQI